MLENCVIPRIRTKLLPINNKKYSAFHIKWNHVSSVFCILICFVLLTESVYAANTESDSSDLIFDDAPSISATKLQHPVIQGETQNDGWLSHNLKRIKRQLWGWPFTSSETTTSAPTTTESVVTDAPEAPTTKSTSLFGGINFLSGFGNDKKTKTEEQPSSTTTNDGLFSTLFANLARSTTTEKSTSTIDQDVPAQLLDNESELTESREKRNSNEDEYNNFDQDQDQTTDDINSITDDEDAFDNLGLSSGEASGASPTEPIEEEDQTSDASLHFYRISFTITEPYRPEFGETNSVEFHTVAQSLAQEVKSLLQDLPGKFSTRVINIEQRPSDLFTSKITLDVGVQGYDDKDEIRNRIRRHIEQFRKLGTISASTEDFHFKDVSGESSCAIDEYPCDGDKCYSQSQRCDGTKQCSDGTDEQGCLDTKIEESNPEEEDEEETYEENIDPEEDFDREDFDREEDLDRENDRDSDVDRDGEGEPRKDSPTTEPPRPIPTARPTESTPVTEDRIIPQTSYETENRGTSCRGDDQVRCANHNEIFICKDQECDGVDDCPDGSDEINCADNNLVCIPGEFNCDETRCIDAAKQCDGIPDCNDGTDEKDCPGSCRENEFRCRDGSCIPASKRCNNVVDCPGDDEDEKNCSLSSGVCPTESHFQCSRDECITIDKRCDGHYDCKNFADELKCPCGHNTFKCVADNSVCIPLERRCNGVYDCFDKSDEKNCHEKSECPIGTFECLISKNPDIRDCIDERRKCDNRLDCIDGSDESNCKDLRPCQPYEYRCHNGDCIGEDLVCDGNFDCQSHEDEQNCDRPTSAPATCRDEEFTCVSDNECIEQDKRCDGIPDCLDESDEDGCNFEEECNPSTEFRCDTDKCLPLDKRCNAEFDCEDGTDEEGCDRCYDGYECTNGECISEDKRCDRVRDCNDGSDEEDCKFECPPDQFRCNTGVCLNIRRRCDGTKECPDGSDELNCPNNNNNKEFVLLRGGFNTTDHGYDDTDECRDDEFRCNDGTCLLKQYRCDKFTDCDDGSDEENCPSQTDDCTDEQFQCSDGNCIPKYLRCNGVPDCTYGDDESDCPTNECPSGEFKCLDNEECIPESRRCDRRVDCRDGSDERNCCEPSQFACTTGECIPLASKCDNVYDCPDGSDERNCRSDTTTTTTTTTQRYYPRRCPSGQWQCSNGDCIPSHYVCDSKQDCSDRSDESNCPEDGDTSLKLRTYPDDQTRKEVRIRQGDEVVFQCRDEGLLRARVNWSRADGRQLPPGSTQVKGRLEIPNIQMEHSGAYVCEALGVPPNTPGNRKTVYLQVEPVPPAPTYAPSKVCSPNESTCSNGDCIPRSKVCDGNYDCTDGSDESCTKICEPMEFRCGNGQCVLKSWICDSENDCGDNTDEKDCEQLQWGSQCRGSEFSCHSGNQCIPKSFQCDSHNDCSDGSDEIGCSPIYFTVRPPPMLNLEAGQILEITCVAIGVPTPLISWRRNWGYVPDKCTSTSVNGTGILRCPDFQAEDQGAYSCEAVTRNNREITDPNTIVKIISEPKICPRGYFNDDARDSSECISCFCFGATDICTSADLFTYQLPPPPEYTKVVGVRTDRNNLEIRDEPIYRGQQPRLVPIDGYGVSARLPYGELTQPNIIPYLALPDTYLHNQLKSYGGYLKYNVEFRGNGRQTTAPAIILTGNGYTLAHEGQALEPNRNNNVKARLFVGEWLKYSPYSSPTVATRAEIMMALENVDKILVKLSYVDGPTLDTTIRNLEMDSAGVRNTGLGQASYVEKCECPVGYSGLSCEHCASGYNRHSTGPWLGTCTKEVEVCQPGTYGDPANGIPCQRCPCPTTEPGRQFASTCSLRDGQVVCDCQQGYSGSRCEYCEPGYTGNPIVGDPCRVETGQCNAIGSRSPYPNRYGECECKILTTGSTCDHCKPGSFHLAAPNQFGCISCFCMGITRKCKSSNWYRDTIESKFTTSVQGFELVSSDRKPIDGVRVIPNSREIFYNDFSRPGVYYWSLPSRYLGDKVTSYGGYLEFTLKYEPTPGGMSSKNSAPDVELISEHDYYLMYFNKETPQPSTPQTIKVPLLEQYWQRSDGQPADREHMLMALADLKNILIKATYTTNTNSASLVSVSLDIANEISSLNTFKKALEVEQCTCPAGYRGLSCEDCDAGYTRSDEGGYLRACKPCECNGHSSICHPETGECRDCDGHTTGDFCDECLPGYEGDPLSPQGCRQGFGSHNLTCDCNPDGSLSDTCYNGECSCKDNVEGSKCDRCRPGTFALSGTNPSGCTECFCSGVTSQCHDSNLWVEQIPIQIDDNHEFKITDLQRKYPITSDFIVNESENEVGYHFRGGASHMYWSLPPIFTGNKVKSYGGTLTYTLRFSATSNEFTPDQDIVIIGNGITIYWSNNLRSVEPDEPNKIAVSLATTAEWQRIDYQQAPRPASRADILSVLSNIDAILIRATPFASTVDTYISDVTLDTALSVPSGQHKAVLVEQCRCPEGYGGSSCETCETGYYRDIYDTSAASNGACKKCPCNGNEESCSIGPSESEVICNCLEGFSGPYCTPDGEPNPDPQTTTPDSRTELPPTIRVTIREPVIKIVEIGGEARYNCIAKSLITSQNVPTRWIKLGGEIPHERAFDDNRGNLVIKNVRVSDSGTYVCQAQDDSQIVEERATLVVGGNRPTRPEVTISPKSYEIQEGQPIEFRCTAIGNPAPTLRWTRVDGPLNPRHEFRDGIFRIRYVTMADEGEYKCIGSNAAGYDEQTVRIYGPSSTAIPVIKPPTELNIDNGTEFTLRCLAPSSHNQEIRWEKSPGELPRDISERDGALTVYNAQPEDTGYYTCVVESRTGERPTVGRSKPARVIVRVISTYPTVVPVTRVEPEEQTIAQGTTIEIRCIASGEPKPKIKWTRVGAEFGPNIQQYNDVLRINNVQARDSGEYVCIAENNAGYSKSTSFVNVEREDLQPPVIELYPQAHQVVLVGNSVVLQCYIRSGSPTPQLTWARVDGVPMPRDVVETQGTLQFSGITREASGEYVCTARNEAGETNAIGVIEVQSKPEITIQPPGERIILKEGERLRLECRARGEPQPTVAWSFNPRQEIGLRLNNVNVERQLTAVHEISAVTRDDQGLYTCVARNPAGITEERIELIVDDNEIDNDRGPERGDIGSQDIVLRPETPESLNVSANTKAVIRCRTGADKYGQAVRLRWVRPGGDLPPNSTESNGILTINRVTKADEGRYSCVVYNPNGEILFTANTYLNVHDLPHITLSPKRQIVRPGDNAFILCEADGTGPINLHWSALDRPFPRTAVAQNGELRFYRIQVSDAGRYRCTATSPVGTADSVAEVVVNEIVRPPVISAINRNVEQPEGVTASLECTVQGNDQDSNRPHISWNREGNNLPSKARIEGSKLIIENLERSDEGRYVCQLSTGGSDYINLIVTRSELLPPVLNIEPSLSTIRSGNTVDLRCVGANPGSSISWRKDRGPLPHNCQTRGELLRIASARPDINNGLYTCETSDSSGNYNVDFVLNVEQDETNGEEEPADLNETIPQRGAPEITYAKRGSSITMDCTTDLREPVDYEWSRQYGTIRDPSNTAVLYIPNISVNDADTYICRTTNDQSTLETRNVLVVTEIVPYFGQSPLSYLAYKPINHGAYLKFIIEISFKPTMLDGMILYNGHKPGSPDFLSVFLKDGIPEFRFNCGSQTAKIRGDRALELDQWHTIKISRIRRQGYMYVDGYGPFKGIAMGKHQGLDLLEPLFVGGIPNYIQLASEAGPNTGFVGCISRLVINHVEFDLLQEAHENQGVTNCETCSASEDICKNGGICQEALTKTGHKCICPPGRTGPHCERTGQSCYEGICGVGKCIENLNGIECHCPLNKTGEHCEQTISITEPAFAGDAYIAYPTPKPKKLKMSLRFNPATLKDGLLFYCGESEEGNGDFTSLAIKDGRLEFKIDTGTGPVTVRSNSELKPGKWVIVTAMKMGSEVRLMLDGESPLSVKSTSQKPINLQTPLYVGGFDKQRVTLNNNVDVNSGFEGCISGVEVSGENLVLVTSAVDAANVQDCSNIQPRNPYRTNDYGESENNNRRPSRPPRNPCDSSPCTNNGRCHQIREDEFFCTCIEGYTGSHCEIAPNMCDKLRPCQNGGTCSGSETEYKCDCPLFYSGRNCEQRVEIRSDARFTGDGYLELSGDLLRTGLQPEKQQQIALQFTTASSDGLLLWYGQEPNVDGRDRDYISMAVVGGYLEVAWNVETRSTNILYDNLRVDDNVTHTAIFKRDGSYGILDIDHTKEMFSELVDAYTDKLHCNGNIYLGGTPNIILMTGQKYTQGFNGCINAIELQNIEEQIDFGTKALSGVNVKPCSDDDGDDDEDDDNGDDFVN
ncbi:basement membrane-specific heparan sulfate proteoglycan core protein-like isoform X3 [Chrysoperla carnea]|uniref:basement membrane-specific heparan sulfate proteoglycan core protein-like isoform X3 n=1 Tax=Chrysoperla carnea TaxID=189513 RepID=UPI001D05FB5D|nr:basement membrane-specific heparan sulfate proteoglycan core protein-like isoform X3 [Chrysoperla carnea]